MTKSAGKMNGAQFLARTLNGYGVTCVFFVESILRQTLIELEALGVRRVLTHSEKAAAYMADGYARIHGGPGVCMAQSVGAANLAAGLQDPYLGRSPVIAITSRKPPDFQNRNAYQEVFHHPLYAPVTKFNVNVDTVEQLPFALRQAFREAVSGTPRPVHLDLEGISGEITEQWEVDSPEIVEETYARIPPHRPCAEESRLREAATVLAKAEQPVIVAGAGTTASGAGAELVELAEALAIPVATSLGGKGLIAEDHPLALGVVGRYSRWCANRVVSEADLVLFVGSHTGDHVTHAWQVPRLGTSVIQIDIDPLELGRSYPDTLGLMGDPKVTLRGLIECLGRTADKKEKWAEHARSVVAEWRSEVEPLGASDSAPIRVERLCRDLAEALPPDAVLVVDTGFSGIWTGAMVPLTKPGQSFISTAGSLGWSVAGALGAKCAAPDRPVVCFCGDGGFYYHMAELETAARCGINTVTIVNNNASLQQCKVIVDRLYENRSGNKDELTAFQNVDFARIAEEMGCRGIRVEKPQEIAPALKEAFAEKNRPVLVDVVTDLAHPAPEPWTPPESGK